VAVKRGDDFEDNKICGAEVKRAGPDTNKGMIN
jgi:hypothetical protein